MNDALINGSEINGTAGEPFTGVATGFIASVHFGSSVAVYDHIGLATGFISGGIGEPTHRHWFRASSVGMVTRFGLPTTPHNVSQQVTGFVSGGVGTPISLVEVSPSPNFFVAVSGFNNTAFGTPVYTRDETGISSGMINTVFGTPKVAASGQAQGFVAGNFGTPSSASVGTASGFIETVFGTPIVNRAEQVAGFTKTRFGTPYAIVTGNHQAYGFCSTWFGNPKGRDSFGGTASGIYSTQFGAPSTQETHIVSTIQPTAIFGTPLLVRNPLC